ncbi:MAG: hypothetical protein B7Z12_02095 [Caulobacter vibrioides]|jgi:hypothetical protein|uniref:HEAT repeat domain-containing protein n=1 Tax=Caulobacter vibrioides TaxID=155892 RepID=A0A258DDZ9_CAUVI|nr:MAG: hypothetical protein B7Z12_02095 [Caulobacter vibrioides]
MASSDDLRQLETIADADQRNALALRLAQAGTPGLDAVLAKLIQRPDLADKRAPLVHAMSFVDCSNHVALLVELVASGGSPVAHEALQALETVDEADADDVEKARAILDRARSVANLESWRETLLEELAELFD